MKEWLTNPNSKPENSRHTHLCRIRIKSFKDADVNLVRAQGSIACATRMGKNAQHCADARTVRIKGRDFTLKSTSRTCGRFPIFYQSELMLWLFKV